MLSYGRQTVEEDDIRAVISALRSDNLTQGKRVRLFEELICEYTGAKYCVVCSSGTAALYLAYRASGLKEEDSIITTPVTFLSTVTAAIHLGGVPAFCDIEPVTYNMDTGLLEDAIERCHNPHAIVPVHFGGLPCDMERIREVADGKSLFVIEDACHALGSKWKDTSGRWHRVGDCAFSDMTVFSFHPVKTITTCEGGAITTNDKTLYTKLLHLREHGITRHEKSFIGAPDGPWYYELVEPSFNFRISDVHCALGINQLRKVERFIDRRQKIAALYRELLSGYHFIKTPCEKEEVVNAYHLYPVRIAFENIGVSKKAWFKEMEAKGIRLQVHYIPIHLQPYIQWRYGFRRGDFPESERFYREEVSLPIYPLLTDNDVKRVTEELITTLTTHMAA